LIMPKFVTVDLRPLRLFAAAIEKQLRTATAGPVHNAIKQWAYRYRSFAKARFAKFSRGGGNWHRLEESTKKRRRKARRGYKGGRRFSILWDTGKLIGALEPRVQTPGQLTQSIPFGVRVGYGGPARHPRGRATIADIASFHQEGIPVGKGGAQRRKREIIVEPDSAAIEDMTEYMLRALDRLGKSVEHRG